MADADDLSNDAHIDTQSDAPLSRKVKLGFGALILSIIIVIAGVFFYAFSLFTAPAPIANSASQERLEAGRMSEDMADNLTDNQTAEAGFSDIEESLSEEGEMADMDGDGVLDFTGPDYRYYAFETPFVSNLTDSKKLLTLELSLLIKRPAFFVDGELEDLMKLAPAMRSQILNYLIGLTPDRLQTREHRKELARNIRLLLNQYLQADNQDDQDGILEVQILKMVVA